MLSFEHAQHIGTALLISIGLLGAYVLLLRVREYYRESPDPKLTYTSRTEHEKLRQQVTEGLRDHRSQLEHHMRDLRLEMDRLKSMLNLQHGEISASTAQHNLFQQRLNELSIKLDRLIERQHQVHL